MSADAAKGPRLDLTPRGKRVAIGVAVGMVVVLAVAVLALAGGGGGGKQAPASAAAKLVPADALVYVHLSTDPDRAQTRDAAKVAEGFPSYAALRDGIVSRLAAPGCDVGTKALKTADEAALAIFDTGTTAQANSLVLIDTGKEHPGAKQRACGSLSSTYVGTFLAIGQPESLAAAARLHKADGKGSLAAASGPAKELGGLPSDRVADGWFSADGLRRLLAPQGGLLGAAGVLFDQPTLVGAAFGIGAKGDRVTLTVKSQLDPKLKGSGAGSKPFKATLASAVPADAMAYLGVSNLAPALQRVLAAGGSTSATIKQLAGSLNGPLLKAFPGEAAVVLTEATPAPILTIIAAAKDPAAAQKALDALPAAVRKTLSSAVFDGKVAVSTDPKGIAAVKAKGERLTDTANWRKAVGNHPDLLGSLLFLDFTRLLKLGEATGLGDSSAYQAAKGDLTRVQAIGASTTGNDSESTAEISLLITQ
jgi:hypothetical protein